MSRKVPMNKMYSIFIIRLLKTLTSHFEHSLHLLICRTLDVQRMTLNYGDLNFSIQELQKIWYNYMANLKLRG